MPTPGEGAGLNRPEVQAFCDSLQARLSEEETMVPSITSPYVLTQSAAGMFLRSKSESMD